MIDNNEFRGNLSALIAMKLDGDVGDIAMVIERLTDSLGLAIAVSCGGDTSKADDMLMRVDGYLVECVANHAKLAQFLKRIGKGT